MSDSPGQRGENVGAVSGPVILLAWEEGRTLSPKPAILVFAAFEFDPEADLRLGSEGCWEWNANRPELRRWAVEYFASRQEDGAVEELQHA